MNRRTALFFGLNPALFCTSCISFCNWWIRFLNSFLNQTRNTMCCKNCDLSNVYFKKILFSSITTFPTFCFFYLKFYTLYFYKQHFYKQRQAGICKKKQAKTKQHPKAELLLFENYSLSSSTLSSKNNRKYSKKCAKKQVLLFNDVIWLITMKIRLKMKIR